MSVSSQKISEDGQHLPGRALLSASRRTERLTLPAVHNRDTTKLIEIVTARDVTQRDLTTYCHGLAPLFVFAVIQSVARRLGLRWEQDEISFGELSISLSRLHEILNLACAHLEVAELTSSLAVIVQPFDDHMLGGVLLDARLRYAGYATCFFPSWAHEPLGDFDGILISVCNSDRIAELPEFLSKIRKSARASTPVIVGGPGASSAGSLCDADLVTSSLIDAVSLCERRLAAG